MKKTNFFSLLTLSVLFYNNQSMAQNEIVDLWPEGKVPNNKTNSVVEKSVTGEDGILRISGVTVPTMAVYLPEKSKASGSAVMICPGGGYGILAAGHEGSDLAKWFNERGVAAFVLKYRLPTEKAMTNQHEVALMDAMKGITIIRENAAKWNIKSDKIGVMGFSAGGHLAATLSTHHNKGKQPSEMAKPNFSILLYPVISLSPELAHGGSRTNLLGPDKDDEMLIRYYSNELHVDEATPPAFLVHSIDDKGVSYKNSVAYADALNAKNIPVEVHIYPKGGHGYALRTEGKGSLAGWPTALEGWMKSMDLMK
jgi:acetyl esterase/lipase